MAVSEDDVRHIATLARLGLDPARVPELVQELNGILEHMEELAAVDATDEERPAGFITLTMLRPDTGPQLPLQRPCEAFAPEMRDGFFLVPRLASHEGDGERSP